MQFNVVNSSEHNQACQLYLVHASPYVQLHIKKFCEKYLQPGTVIFEPENIWQYNIYEKESEFVSRRVPCIQHGWWFLYTP